MQWKASHSKRGNENGVRRTGTDSEGGRGSEGGQTGQTGGDDGHSHAPHTTASVNADTPSTATRPRPR